MPEGEGWGEGWAEGQARAAEARGDHERAAYFWSIKAEVDKAPPLSSEQKSRLRILLRPVPAAEAAHPAHLAPTTAKAA